jgi:hypothetical protein
MNYKPSPDDVTKVVTPVGLYQRTVVCAANKFANGLIVCGARHFDPIMRAQLDAIEGGRPSLADHEQGFIDQWGNFMSRTEASVVACSSGQKMRNPDVKPGDTLYSEDLY